MILKYIKLRNIRSYVNEKIDFTTGSQLLCGDIGSGKSTILLAVEFALFGIKKSDYSGASLLRNGEKEGHVELKFIIDQKHSSKEVIIHRNLKKSSSSIRQENGYIIINGHKKEATPVELKSEILDILGYPKTLLSKSKDLIYRYTVYTPQEEMKQILFSDKEERLNTLRRVFNIDRYKRIRENLTIITKKMRDKIKELQGRTYSLPEKSKEYKNIIKEANEITRQIKELIPQIKKSRKIIEELEEKEKNLYNDFIEFKEINNNISHKKEFLKTKDNYIKNLNKEKQSLQKDIERINEKIKDLNVEDIGQEIIENKENEIENLSNNINNVKNENNLLDERIKGAKKQIKELSEQTKSKRDIEKRIAEKKQEEKNLALVISQKSSLEKDIEKVEKIIKALQNQITESGVKHKSCEKIISDIAELDDCPTCHQKVTSEYKKDIISSQKDKMKNLVSKKKEKESSLNDYEQRLKKSKQNLANAIEKEKEKERIKAEIENLEKTFKEFDQKRKHIEELEKKVEFFKSKIKDKEIIKKDEASLKKIKEEIKILHKKYSEKKEKEHLQNTIKDKNNSINKIIDNISTENEIIIKTKTEIAKLQKNAQKLKDSEKQLKEITQTLNSARNQDRELENKKAGFMSQRNSLVKTKELLEKEITDMRTYKEKILYLTEMKTWLTDYFSNMTVLIERNIMMRIYSEFNELFKEWFNMMIEDEIVNVRLDDEFTPIVEQNGYEINITDLSGGEKTSCALAYRLALNKVINDCIDTIRTNNLIILDEPTDGFSDQQLDRLREVLDQLKIEQIILVSHETKIESFVDNIIRINKSEHVSFIL